MSENKTNKKTSDKKENSMSILDEKNLKEGKNGGASISLVHNGEKIDGSVESPKHRSLFTKSFSDKEKEIVVVSNKKTKGYAPTVFAIILFSFLLFVNVLCEVKLDGVSNDLAAMTRELEELKESEKIYSQKLAEKDKEALDEQASYIEGELGMVKEDPEKVYVDLPVEDETVIIENTDDKSGWTTLLSSVGRFFSDIFG